MVSLAIPIRPYTRAPGSLDNLAAVIDNPHIPNEAAPGVQVRLDGWILDSENAAIDQAWVDIGGSWIPVSLDRNRLDVARTLALRDRDGRKLGFDTVADIPRNVAPGIYDIRVIGRTRSGTGVYAETAQRVLIAFPQTAANLKMNDARDVAFDVRLRDTQAASHTLGRGAYTIRQESSLRISGFLDTATHIHAIATSQTGNRVAWDFPCNQAGRFDAVLWTGDLDRGLYELSVCLVEDNGAWPAARCGFDIAGPHYLPPLHLTSMLSAPLAEVTTFKDVGPMRAGSSPGPPVAGRPIGIEGWCIDPASSTPPLAIYAAVDDRRPIPISHHLSDPRPDRGRAEIRCGFGGIIDTTRLEPGPHRIRILAAAVSGAGWYIVDDQNVDLHDHREQSRTARG
jgi:hypothetical protein